MLLSSEIPKGMKSYGPKSIIPIGKPEEPLIIKQIKKIKLTYGSTKHNINVVTGFESEKIHKILHKYKFKNITLIEDDCYDVANNTYGLAKAFKTISGNSCLIIQSGVVGCYKPKMPKRSSMGILKTKDVNFNIGVREKENQAVYMFYDLENIWSEMAFIGSDDYNRVTSIIMSDEFEPKTKSLFLFETLNFLIERNIVFDLERIKDNKNITKHLHYKTKTNANIYNKQQH